MWTMKGQLMAGKETIRVWAVRISRVGWIGALGIAIGFGGYGLVLAVKADTGALNIWTLYSALALFLFLALKLTTSARWHGPGPEVIGWAAVILAPFVNQLMFEAPDAYALALGLAFLLLFVTIAGERVARDMHREIEREHEALIRDAETSH